MLALTFLLGQRVNFEDSDDKRQFVAIWKVGDHADRWGDVASLEPLFLQDPGDACGLGEVGEKEEEGK